MQQPFLRSPPAWIDLTAWGLGIVATLAGMTDSMLPPVAQTSSIVVALCCWLWVGPSLLRERRQHDRRRVTSSPNGLGQRTSSDEHAGLRSDDLTDRGNHLASLQEPAAPPASKEAETMDLPASLAVSDQQPLTVTTYSHVTRSNLSSQAGKAGSTGSRGSSCSSPDESLRIQTVCERLSNHPAFDSNLVQIVENELRSATGSEPQHVSADDLVGTTIGKYSLVRLIGTGGEGAVYECQPLGDGPRVALKLLAEAAGYERFRREMRLVQHLAHPNIVVCYDFGIFLDRPYYVMELLQGPNLYELIRDQGPMKWERALALIRQAASALNQAHQRGLVHCDVKPGNLVLHGDQLKLIDLGLAGLNSEFSSPDTTMGAGRLAGTIEFMSPEQAHGSGPYGPATDVFGLGATLYYLLTGRPLVPGRNWRDKLLFLHGQEEIEVPAICGCPERIRRLISRMTCRDSDARLPDMNTLLVSLDNILAEERSIVAPPSAVRVLVVEDDEDDLFLTAQMLARANQSVEFETANCLQMALWQIERLPAFDLILADLHLPDSRGVATVQQLARACGSARVVAMSILDGEEMTDPCIQAGAVDYICKHELTVRRLERAIFVTLSRTTPVPPKD